MLKPRMASETYHEPYELLSAPTRDMHRGIWTLIEELEAIDWYQQRADVCGDDALRAVLIHNKNEEIEHAMMTLEWLRRTSAEIDANLRTYVFTEGPITDVEANADVPGNGGASVVAGPERGGGAAPRPAQGSLGIGSLRRG